MRKYIFIISLVLSCIPMTPTWAAYNGPTKNFSASISNIPGDGQNEYDVFVVLYFVRSDGTYVEPEGTDINIYGSSGLIRHFSISNGPGVNGDTYFFDQYIYIEGFGSKKGNIYIYDYTGNLKSTINSYTGSFESALQNGEFFTHTSKTENYYRYSLSGQLLKAYTSRPLELGVVQKQPLGNRKYKTTITYDDRVYVIIDRQYSNFQRDENKNLYAVEPGFVNKFSPCGKLLGKVKMPSDVVFREENVTGREPEFIQHDLYGGPQIDVHGNVYTWEKTPTKYVILKWTWVDDPNVPTGPEPPTNLSLAPSINGLYLTWQASPNDPGCVTKYEIARATTSGGVFSTIDTVEKGVLKYNDTTAEVGTTYYYKVRVMAGSDPSVYTSAVSGKR